MLVDEVEITVRAGNGGDGRISFHHEKSNPKGGPDGGHGGNGGNLYFRAVSDLSALRRYRNEKDFAAQDGQPGGKDLKTGAGGEDLTLIAPVGTVITNLDTGVPIELIVPDTLVLVAKGGRGGRGNWSFRSSTNQTPREFEPGSLGEHFSLKLELRLIADVGFIGLPSAGKSSLLNELTDASVPTAAYPFTTLEPNLGEMDGLILADLPGLIEGASTGKGLGIRFLKHIKRTKIIAHCVSADSADVIADYQTIRQELADYSADLMTKKEIIVLTRTDLVDAKTVKQAITKLVKLNNNVIPTSIHDYASIINLKSTLVVESGTRM